MPAAATKKASQSSGGESAKHTAAKPMAATSPPTRISRGGGQSRRRTRAIDQRDAHCGQGDAGHPRGVGGIQAQPVEGEEAHGDLRHGDAEHRHEAHRQRPPQAAVADRQGGAAVRLATLLARQPAPERQQGDQGSAPVTSNGRTSP